MGDASDAVVSASVSRSLSTADDEQRRLMEERVIVTDYYDNPIGAGSKKESASASAAARALVRASSGRERGRAFRPSLVSSLALSHCAAARRPRLGSTRTALDAGADGA